MNDIEKMLRKGISAEDIINEVHKTQALLKEEEKRKQKEEEEKQKNYKALCSARTSLITSIIRYGEALGIEFSDDEVKATAKELTKALKEEEKFFRTLTDKKSTSELDSLESLIKTLL